MIRATLDFPRAILLVAAVALSLACVARRDSDAEIRKAHQLAREGALVEAISTLDAARKQFPADPLPSFHLALALHAAREKAMEVEDPEGPMLSAFEKQRARGEQIPVDWRIHLGDIWLASDPMVAQVAYDLALLDNDATPDEQARAKTRIAESRVRILERMPVAPISSCSEVLLSALEMEREKSLKKAEAVLVEMPPSCRYEIASVNALLRIQLLLHSEEATRGLIRSLEGIRTSDWKLKPSIEEMTQFRRLVFSDKFHPASDRARVTRPRSD